MLAGYEYANVGVQWSNYEGRDARAYSFASCLRMMLLDTLLYFLLACYLDKVSALVYQVNICVLVRSSVLVPVLYLAFLYAPPSRVRLK